MAMAPPDEVAEAVKEEELEDTPNEDDELLLELLLLLLEDMDMLKLPCISAMILGSGVEQRLQHHDIM